VDNYGNPDREPRDLVLSGAAPADAAVAQTASARPPVVPASSPAASSPAASHADAGDLRAAPPSSAPRGTGIQMRQRRPVGVWLLALATLGGYGLVHWYKIHCELRDFDRRRHVSPGFELLSISVLAWTIILPFLSISALAGKIRLAQAAAGLPQSCSGTTGIGRALLFGTHMIYYQRKLNEIIHVNPVPRGEHVLLKV
jgi:hypothetical protein